MDNKRSFKGLRIAEVPFEAKTSTCSLEVEGSCGNRDCPLQVYYLGDEKIITGGICPKGNTQIQRTKAPNYTELYNKILNKHLSRFSLPLEELVKKENAGILIPRALSFLNERGILYTSIYNNLGFNVGISPASNDEISELGKKFSHPENCYPVILSNGHIAYLAKFARPIDKILLVNAISSRGKKFCPYVESAGYVGRGNLNIDDKQVLMPVLYFEDEHNPLDKSIHQDLSRVFGKRAFNIRKVRIAVEKALDNQESFKKEVYELGRSITDKLKERGEEIFIGIGRGYTLLDSKASSSMAELFATNSLHFIPSVFFNPGNQNIDQLFENMYWDQGERIIRFNLNVAKEDKMNPVRATNFSCGPDSLLLYYEKEIMGKENKPLLVLETDGHNSNAQFGTRILAYNEVIRRGRNNVVEMQKDKKVEEDLEGRLIGIPFMSEASSIMAAVFENMGKKAEVIPTRTAESIRISKKLVETNTCQPFAYQVGDVFSWLEKLKESSRDVNQSAAIFLPSAGGPCRFGQYAPVLRKILDKNGFEGVKIVSPTSSKDYHLGDLEKDKAGEAKALVYRGTSAFDVLQNALHRVRPYEKVPGQTEKVFTESLDKLLDLVKKGSGILTMRKMLRESYNQFKSIETEGERKPLVLMNGEIFVRCHPEANQESIKLLEKFGLEVMLEPITGWMNYVNQWSLRKNWHEKNYSALKESIASRAYMKFVDYSFNSQFSDLLFDRKHHSPYTYVSKAEKDLIYHSSASGEAPISIGQIHSFLEGELDVDGIYHVGPFGCMQETVATSRVEPIIRNAEKRLPVPIMHAVFGESELSNLEPLVASFAQKCYARLEMKKLF